jgi:hypothetical protein
MRPGTIKPSICSCSGQDSPPANAVWSTERRLLEKSPPRAPHRKTGRHSSLPYSYGALENDTVSIKKQRVDRLLLPSRTIDEDDESPSVSLAFRPTRLFVDNDELFGFAQHIDPTTVLLVPQVHLPWLDEMDGDDDDDDMTLSPRLFRFGSESLSRVVPIDAAKDKSEDIFRHEGALEAREIATDTAQRRSTWASTMARSQDDDRV